MSDVINGVPRKLLERIACEVTPKTHQEMFDSAKDFAAAIKELRALLAEQPKASAAQSAQWPTTPGLSARPSDDDLWDQTLSERDSYHESADKLTDAIAKHFGQDFGEHSSLNAPWENALEFMRSLAAQSAPDESLPEEQFCYCNGSVSLQIVSGGAHPLGYLGEVTLKVGDEYVKYIRAQSAPAGEREARTPMPEILYGPATHVTWTPDHTPKEQRRQVVLVDAEQFAAWQRTQSAVVPEKMQWPEIVALVNEVLGCEAHKFPCERGSIGHEMTGINFNSLARIIDRVRHRLAAAPAQPAAQDQGEVQRLREALESAIHIMDSMQSEIDGLISYAGGTGGFGEYTESIKEARAALAASTGQEVKP